MSVRARVHARVTPLLPPRQSECWKTEEFNVVRSQADPLAGAVFKSLHHACQFIALEFAWLANGYAVERPTIKFDMKLPDNLLVVVCIVHLPALCD